jgi:hypothetical protein
VKKIYAIAIVALLLTWLVPSVGSADSDSINITLTPSGSIEINVNRTHWTFEVPLNTTGNTSLDWGLIENNGTIAAYVEVMGTNTSDWTLGTAQGHNQFNLSYIYNATVTGNITLEQGVFIDNLGAGENETFGLKVHMPVSTSVPTNQTTTIYFIGTPK